MQSFQMFDGYPMGPFPLYFCHTGNEKETIFNEAACGEYPVVPY